MSENRKVLRAQIIAAARSWIDTPYQHQASLRGVGCDCLGLVRGVWRDVIGAEPEAPHSYTPDWAEAGGSEQLAQAAARHLIATNKQAFCGAEILLFRWRSDLPAKHMAIATSPDWMIHAHDGARACEVPITRWWRRRLAFVFEFPNMDRI